MSPEQRAIREQCRALFGDPAAPEQVWEHEFDHDDAALRQLGRKDWREIGADELARCYLLNLVYVEPLQPDLFRYLFPLCLACWHDTLTDRDAHPFEDWQRALRRPHLFDAMMTPAQAQAVHAFILDSLLARLDRERGFVYEGSRTPAYAWLGQISALGAGLPLIEPLWQRWWTVDTPGKAVSALMYLSALIYLDGENPIFGAWTRQHGGGGPYLAEAGDEAWLPRNLDALRRQLTLDQVLAVTAASARRLRAEPESVLAARIAADAQARQDIIAIQIDDLIANLADPSRGFP